MSDQETPPGVPLGQWDHVVAICGRKGYGKSTLAMKLAREWSKTPAYIIVHDPTHGVVGEDVHRHQTSEGLFNSLHEHPGGIHTLVHEDGMHAITAALKVAQDARRAPATFADGTLNPAEPVVLVLDEVVMIGGMSPSYVQPMVAKAFAEARHCHLAIIWCTQRPTMVHPLVWDLTNEIFIMRTIPRWRKSLEESGLPVAMIERSRKLKKFQALNWRAGEDDEDDNEDF